MSYSTLIIDGHTVCRYMLVSIDNSPVQTHLIKRFGNPTWPIEVLLFVELLLEKVDFHPAMLLEDNKHIIM